MFFEAVYICGKSIYGGFFAWEKGLFVQMMRFWEGIWLVCSVPRGDDG